METGDPPQLAHVTGHGRGGPIRTNDGVDASGIHPVLVQCSSCRSRGANYWTVTVAFMFMARCGTHTYSYVPGGILPKETV